MLQAAANAKAWGSDCLRFDVKTEAKCGRLFKLDRVEFVCTFEPFTPRPFPHHHFYQPSPSVYSPTQTWTHFGTKPSIKNISTPQCMRTNIGHIQKKRNKKHVTYD